MKLIRIKKVAELTGLSKPYIYVLVNKGVFPKKVRLTQRTSAWVEQEVLDWIQHRIDIRDQKVTEKESCDLCINEYLE